MFSAHPLFGQLISESACTRIQRAHSFTTSLQNKRKGPNPNNLHGITTFVFRLKVKLNRLMALWQSNMHLIMWDATCTQICGIIEVFYLIYNSHEKLGTLASISIQLWMASWLKMCSLQKPSSNDVAATLMPQNTFTPLTLSSIRQRNGEYGTDRKRHLIHPPSLGIPGL